MKCFSSMIWPSLMICSTLPSIDQAVIEPQSSGQLHPAFGDYPTA